MSHRYRAVQWNRFKWAYDAALALGIAGFLALFEHVLRTQQAADEAISEPVRHMRAYGSCAFLLLTLILCIGPLARLHPRWKPLLYNRRHLGVAMCGVALLHANAVLGFYLAYSDVPERVALFRYDTSFTRASAPFQLFGALALLILLLMAATSHDFWQKFLGARAWKGLHMLVYLAYAAAVCHVAFGPLQVETHPIFALVFAGAVLSVCGLQLMAARKSTALDRAAPAWVELEGVRYLDAGPVQTIPEDRARPLCVPGAERIAVVRHAGHVSAVHGVCAHQGGPLYEGKVIDGCLTCPWHGWQYKPEDGCAPAPFVERIHTYHLRLKSGRVLVDPRPLPPGTAVAPVLISLEADHDSAA